MATVSEENCLKWLKTKYNANIKREWLEACIEFLTEEHGINSIIDVGQSAYSQIQKLKGNDDPDTLRENSSNKESWEKKIKPSRMLYLQMTDGAQNIQGMEYQINPSLRLDIPPGTKVQIKGPIDCRLGVLLLSATNITVLGGSVDELIETNSLWNMLHNAIGKDAPPQRSSVKTSEVTNENPQLSITDTVHSTTNNVQSLQSKALNTTTKNPTLQSNQHSSITSSKRPQSNTRTDSYFNEEDYGNNYFEDTCDENFDFDQLDQMEREGTTTETGNINSSYMDEFEDEMFVDADELMDDDLDDFDLNSSKNTHTFMSASFDENDLKQDIGPTATKQNETSCCNLGLIHPSRDQKKSTFAMTRTSNSINYEEINQNNGTQFVGNSETVEESLEASKVGYAANVKEGLSSNQQKSSVTMTMGSNIINTNFFENKQPKQDELTKIQTKTKSLASKLRNAVDEQVKSALSVLDTANINTTFNNSAININYKKAKAAMATRPTNRKEGSILSHLVPKSEVKEDINPKRIKLEHGNKSSKPYQYLVDVMKELPFQQDKIIRIKGYIATLVSHSQVTDVNQPWRVTVKINDGTAVIDADLGEQVLSQLLGCPTIVFQRETEEARRLRDPIRVKALQQQEFSQLFSVFDEDVRISYLKSFRRVRVSFSDAEHACDAKLVLHGCTYRGSELGVYLVQPIQPSPSSGIPSQLQPPPLTKQFLISPPSSPPVGWEQTRESNPVINYDLLQAMASLDKSEPYELHPPDINAPSIVVHLCDEEENLGKQGEEVFHPLKNLPRDVVQTRRPNAERNFKNPLS